MSEAPKDEKAERADKAEKAEKALRKAEAERGLLDPEGRYKAQINAMKQSQDLIEMGDRKARFALVIMSVLNAVAVLLVVRGSDVVFPTGGAIANIIRGEFGLYIVVTVYYVFQAISALRPRGVRVPAAHELPSQVEPGISMRVLFYGDVVGRDRAANRAVWDALRMDNLTSELADQLYTMSTILHQKYAALDRLYRGLAVLAVLLGTLIGTIALHRALS
jgi:hypothetical protein